MKQFLIHLYESTGSFCCHPDLGFGMDITLTLKGLLH